MFAAWSRSHDEPQYCQRGILMSASVCVEDTKTFIAYLDAINMNIKCFFDSPEGAAFACLLLIVRAN